MNDKAQESLGTALRKAREAKIFSLRYVETATGISNAYLSQLETDKIKKPAADTLYKLAILYKISFDYLLHISGLVLKKSDGEVSIGSFIFSKDNLTKEEEEELINYLQFIRRRKK
jgi:transcriptional regulator with XRE-family HTH domain